MSHTERSVICLHCQKAHAPGFIWNFSDTIRVCFTCYRVMGEEARKNYERGILKKESKNESKKESKKGGYAMKVVGILAVLAAILGASIYFLWKPLLGQVAEHRAEPGQSLVLLHR